MIRTALIDLACFGGPAITGVAFLNITFTPRAAADGENRSRASHRSVVPAGRDPHFPATPCAGIHQSVGSVVMPARGPVS